MKLHNTLVVLLLLLVYSGMSCKAPAEVVIDWVEVGDPGNPATTFRQHDGTTGYGSVDYKYRIGEYEVTNSQYVEFLNAVASTDTHGLFDSRMQSQLWGGIAQSGSSGSYTYSIKPNMGNKPVTFLSFFDAARMANWLHNGQPVGDQTASTTEDGAYTFSGTHTVGFRNPDAQVFVPNEHEWQKAAFYEPGSNTIDGDDWWRISTRSDSFPRSATTDPNGNGDVVLNAGSNVVVFRRTFGWNGSSVGNVAKVGSAGNQTYYGAKDMAGNLFEWVEADPNKPDPLGAGLYIVRGGSFLNQGHVYATERNNGYPHFPGDPGHIHNVPNRTTGMRLGAVFVEPINVPEPTAASLFLLGLALLWCRGKVAAHRVRFKTSSDSVANFVC